MAFGASYPGVLLAHQEQVDVLCIFLWDRGLLERCKRVNATMVAAARARAVPLELARWYHVQAVNAHHVGRLQIAEISCRDGLSVLDETPDDVAGESQMLRGHLLHRLARLEEDRENLAAARVLYSQSSAAKNQTGADPKRLWVLQSDGWSDQVVSTSSRMAVIDELAGKIEDAVNQQHKCLATAKALYYRRPYHLRLARALRKRGDFSEAVQYGTMAAKAAEDGKIKQRPVLAWAEVGLAHLLRCEGGRKVRAAVAALHAALSPGGQSIGEEKLPPSITPGNGLPELATLHLHLDHRRGCTDFGKRIRQYDRIMNNGTVGQVYPYLIRCAGLLWDSEADRARICLDRGRALCETLIWRGERHHDLKYWLALTELALGRPEEGRALYERAIEACPAPGVVAMSRMELRLFFRNQLNAPGVAESLDLLNAAPKGGASAGPPSGLSDNKRDHTVAVFRGCGCGRSRSGA